MAHGCAVPFVDDCAAASEQQNSDGAEEARKKRHPTGRRPDAGDGRTAGLVSPAWSEGTMVDEGRKRSRPQTQPAPGLVTKNTDATDGARMAYGMVQANYLRRSQAHFRDGRIRPRLSEAGSTVGDQFGAATLRGGALNLFGQLHTTCSWW